MITPQVAPENLIERNNSKSGEYEAGFNYTCPNCKQTNQHTAKDETFLCVVEVSCPACGCTALVPLPTLGLMTA